MKSKLDGKTKRYIGKMMIWGNIVGNSRDINAYEKAKSIMRPPNTVYHDEEIWKAICDYIADYLRLNPDEINYD